MKAIVISADSLHGMKFTEVTKPAPTYDRMVIKVTHISLNHGDINDARSGRIQENGILG